MNAQVLLALAIVSEVIATLSLRASGGFTKLLPSALVVLGYGTAYYLLSHVLRTLSVGYAYAVWSALGTAIVAVLGILIFHDRLGWGGAAGITLIIAGVVVLHASAGSTVH